MQFGRLAEEMTPGEKLVVLVGVSSMELLKL